MSKMRIVGAVALVLMSSSLALAQTQNDARAQRAAQNQAAVDGRIAQFKASIRLTAEQERLWPAVEAAIRDAVRQHAVEDARANSVVQWISTNAHAASGDAPYVRRALAAAQPLLRSLDPEQRRNAVTTAKAMGLGTFAAAF